MANVGTAAAGKTLIGAGNGASPTFASIGTNSGLTTHGVVIAEGNGAFVATSAGTAGQVLTSNGASADPTYQNAVRNLAWSDQSGTFTAAAANGYFITAASTPTLPASPSEGDTIAFVVDTGSTCTVTGNTGQKIRLGNNLSGAAGTAANTQQGDSITLVYRSTGTTWFATSSVGNWTIT